MADTDISEEERKAQLAEQRERKKKEKEAAKAAKAAAKAARQEAAQQSAAVPIVIYNTPELPSELFGDYKSVDSSGTTGRTWTNVGSLNEELQEKGVWIRARVHNTRAKGKTCFLVFRQGMCTVQGAMFVSETITQAMIKYSGGLSRESVVDVFGVVKAAEVKSCTQKTVEISVERIYCVSRSDSMLPFTIEDAARSEEEIARSEQENPQTAYNRVQQDTRLDNRIVDMRAPAQNAILRICGAVCSLFREACVANDFVEIHTPKLIAGASEGGAAVFRLKYFDQDACLAQSPQLYKQMAVCGDLERVFEIAPVFRMENSHTHRHLTEFTGLDMEMEIKEHYFEAMDMLEVILTHIFDGLQMKYAHLIDAAAMQYDVTPFAFKKGETNLRLTFVEAIDMLREAGEDIPEYDDITTKQEKLLGRIVKERYGTDFYMVHRFPDVARPFYTMNCPDDPKWTNSYDIYMRGEEICSGAQRIHDSKMLKENAERKGVPIEPLVDYINAFKFGACPHGGGGIGMERVAMLFLGINNVRKTSMFPRDPERLRP